MIEYKSVSVVIPAFNEEASIQELIRRIFAVSKDLEVIVCSDGSTDNTNRLATESGAIVVAHPYNIGNGASIKSGAAAASRDYLIFMDADLQHPPEEIPRLLEHLPVFDLVIGARTQQSKTSVIRNIGNRILIGVAESISGFQIPDLTSGFRAVKKKEFKKFFHLYPLKYSYPTTSTLAFLSSGFFVKFVNVDSIASRTKGESKIRPFRDGMRFIHIILRIILTFHPQKVFLPMSLTLFGTGSLFLAFQVYSFGAIRGSSIIFLISSLVIFLNGMLAEQIAQLRRELFLRD